MRLGYIVRFNRADNEINGFTTMGVFATKDEARMYVEEVRGSTIGTGWGQYTILEIEVIV